MFIEDKDDFGSKLLKGLYLILNKNIEKFNVILN